MRLKKVLAGVLAGALFLTGLPLTSIKGAEGTNLLINGSGEDGMTGWTDPDDVWMPSLYSTNHTAIDGETFFWPSKRACASATMYQDVSITAYPTGSAMRLSAWLANYNQSPHDQATLELSFIDASGNVLASDSSQQRNPEWGLHEIIMNIPSGAAKARVSCIATRFVGSDNDAYFDDIRLVTTGKAVRDVIVTGDKDKVKAGDTIQLSATDGVYSQASDFEWSSSYDQIATVDENGLVTISSDADFADQEVWIYAKCKTTGVVGKYYINSDKTNDPEPEPGPQPEIEEGPEVTATVSVKLKWKAVSGAKGYVVYEYNADEGIYEELASLSKKKTSYVVSDLALGESYSFMVRSFKKSGRKKVFSEDSNIIIINL
ncbi:MAG: Ig-like domain-containing protein [Lachnospiraceae bacterium]|nr:Ig-like domain-containing protein [Lachnospiraceae bacterium]